MRLRLPWLFLALFGCLNAQPRPDGLRLVLTGDSIINRRLSVHSEPDYLAMIERIRRADAAFTNFETLVHNFEAPGAEKSGGTYMASPHWIVDELKWAGFDLLSVANNHAMDYGPDGLRASLGHLEAAGFAFAGAGRNLALARAPAYLDTRAGRVALVACASTFPPGATAGQQRPDLIGRPGVSPLRFQTTYTVDPAALEALRKVATRSPFDDDSGALRFLGARFVAGDRPGVKTEPNADDLKAITASIRDARRQADWVIVSIHAHEGMPGNREIPAEFLVTFARAAIDAGADVFVGHGPHVLRGVEIYRGKPIFYSLANFIFENETVRFQPSENYEQYQLGPDALPSDFYDRRSRNGKRGFPADRLNWESAIAEVAFGAEGAVREISIHPIMLGFGQPRTKRGRPRSAPDEAARSIAERLSKLSAPFGSEIRREGDRWHVVRATSPPAPPSGSSPRHIP